MRISSAAALLLLGACRQAEPDQPHQAVGANVAAAVADPPNDAIECALDGTDGFARECTIETTDDGMLIVRQPDGGFHRLHKVEGESGIAAADGAERAQVTRLPQGGVEVAIGGARYRLPAP